jgi:aryl-alcohol dehydrogenase-like predicted oxidoreductase
MQLRQLGKTGLNVSIIGLGCGSFGGIGSEPSCIGKGASEEESFSIMDRALGLGINFFDTADSYAGGLSEIYIGKC